MSLIKQVIDNSDEELRYPTPGELRVIRDFCKSGSDRIQIARNLQAKATDIVERGTRQFWKICPRTPSNSGDRRKTATAKRDMSWYIRLISYCLLAGNDQPLREIGLTGMKELYTNLGIPLTNIVQYLNCLKAEAMKQLDQADADEVIPYFDELIQEIALPGPPYFMNDGPGESIPV
ncbi:Allophycocyanin alpha-B chain [Halomicronema hongdechloris C2206]|uniref:Allophycocyanin alpha-B chain n=1 Tax=Halomicronema hongdechloris C2206 TaxID=1641165 RepID=A0A1Z3HIP8_9CYAN|nr:allophycocyanin [Halomicronema hongdechloris]ASC70153.1 Allophycocyanin alpha-B chain [Halomicronema hongdechloris C2206]